MAFTAQLYPREEYCYPSLQLPLSLDGNLTPPPTALCQVAVKTLGIAWITQEHRTPVKTQTRVLGLTSCMYVNSTNLVFVEHSAYCRIRFLLVLIIFCDLLMKALLLGNLPVYNISHLLAVRSYQALHCFSVDKRNCSRLVDYSVWANLICL